MFKIQEVTNSEMVSGGRRLDLLVPQDIPEDYPDKAKWTRFFNRVFFAGALQASLLPREEVDSSKALRHFRAVAVSRELKQNHKRDACAYLLSQWFYGVEGGISRERCGKLSISLLL